MSTACRLRITSKHYNELLRHLFPGDRDEHGAVLLAGLSETEGRVTLTVREIHLAHDGIDYVAGQVGYRALTPQFIHRLITRARDERLVYLAIHNHDAEKRVDFSSIDFASHERGYPALLQITRGMPVGALVFGRQSVQADLWMPSGKRLSLDQAVVVGGAVKRLTPLPQHDNLDVRDEYERQVRFFGKAGQAELVRCRVGLIGLGGIGSLVAEYLARLGVGSFVLVDDDVVETTNLSRIVGATKGDAKDKVSKLEVMKRLIHEANPDAIVIPLMGDVAKESVARQLTGCDYLFLAADSMRARLVFNALVHQYLIPGVQLGSKVRAGKDGALLDVLSVSRPVRPGRGCLWCNQLIDPTQLAREAKTDDERRAQAYGVEEPNPSVITLNAVSAAHAVNDFMLDYLALRPDDGRHYYEHFYHLKQERTRVQPRHDDDCPECSERGRRFGKGDLVKLPCAEG